MQKVSKKLVWLCCLLLLGGMAFVISWIQDKNLSGEGSIAVSNISEKTVDIQEVVDIDEVGMMEDTSIYSNDDEGSIVYFYVTVQKGDAGSETDHTFAEVNSVVRFVDDAHYVNDVYANAIVQQGDKNGPQPGMFGYGVTKANARIRVRGNSSSRGVQKSYKLDLKDEAGLWRGQSNIALNKHIYDVTRLRNKLYFDLLRDVEHVPSLRTQYVRLFIKDETSGQTTFQDYGLYTQVEVPTKKYLANHGLDKEGYLYKAISFNFEMSDALKNFDDPEFDLDAFETVLSCKGRKDNEKLIDMVEMIADTSVDINDIIGGYIDRDNYITWLAYNILIANTDTTVQNFYLYSPLNSSKWFFIPWDGDGMLRKAEIDMAELARTRGIWEHGISNYWGIDLHQRFLKYESNRKELEAKVDELHEMINKESVDALVKEYNSYIEQYVTSMPDFYYLGHTEAERNEILAGLGQQVEDSYQAFKRSLHELMPFWMYMVETEGNTRKFIWSDAYDFDNQSITYHIRIAATPDMKSPVVDAKGLTDTYYEVSNQELPEGTWYWQVTAETSAGKTSEAMNKIRVNSVYYPGVDVVEVP